MLLRDPGLQVQVLEVFSRTLADPRDDEAIAAALRALLLSRQVLESTSRTISIVVGSPEIARRARAAIDAIAADADVRAAFDDFMNGW